MKNKFHEEIIKPVQEKETLMRANRFLSSKYALKFGEFQQSRLLLLRPKRLSLFIPGVLGFLCGISPSDSRR